jgi:hypothetical protein
MKDSQVYCPYTKVSNNYPTISGIPTPKTLLGAPIENICMPNLSSKHKIGGFGENKCIQNNPYHISYYNNRKETSHCYSDNLCKNKMTECNSL